MVFWLAKNFDFCRFGFLGESGGGIYALNFVGGLNQPGRVCGCGYGVCTGGLKKRGLVVVIGFLVVVFFCVEFVGWRNVMKCSELRGESGGIGGFLV